MTADAHESAEAIDLVARLRVSAVAHRLHGKLPGVADAFVEAAEAIMRLRVENAALRAELAEARLD
jgi:hypothetical protein